MTRPSLRHRLLGLLLGTLIAGWTAAVVATYVDAHGEIDRLLDAHLAQATGILAAQAGHELLEVDADEIIGAGPYGQGVTFQVWEAGRVLRVRSADAPGERLSATGHGFTDSTVGGRRWRVFSTWDRTGEVLIEVAENHAIRERIARQVALNALSPLAIALPILALLVWLGVGRALRPLRDLGEEVGRRDPLALEPLDAGGAPAETLPLVDRLNELFSRIRRSTDLERRFTADAAHELRNPVAAIRAQAEVARTTPDPATRDAALDRVVGACDRMAGLVDQLLTLARLEQSTPGHAPIAVDLARIAREVIAEMAPAALAENDVEITLDAPAPVAAAGTPELVAIIVRNLAWNAVRHGRTGVKVAVHCSAGIAVLEVSDEGPGVTDDELPQLGERFHQGAGAGAGSGLGLSIVRRIAELHGGRLVLARGDGGRGFVARVEFPATPSGTGP